MTRRGLVRCRSRGPVVPSSEPLPAAAPLDPPDPPASALQNLVLCMKWGTKYSPDYVNRLHRMVQRNLTLPFRLVCFTDDPAGLDPAIQTLPLPELGCRVPERTPGQWRKLALWGESLQGLEGVGLFIDLDSVIVGSLDAYFQHGSPDAVILERNWARPLSGLGQTSVFRFRIGSHPEILARFRRDPQGFADRFRFEQHFVTDCLGQPLNLWPRGWTRHFRLHCLGPDPLRFLRPARLPAGSRIITFPGGPNPGDVVQGKWRPDSPPYGGRRVHLRRQLRSGQWSSVREFVMPVEWIDRYWR